MAQRRTSTASSVSSCSQGSLNGSGRSSNRSSARSSPRSSTSDNTSDNVRLALSPSKDQNIITTKLCKPPTALVPSKEGQKTSTTPNPSWPIPKARFNPPTGIIVSKGTFRESSFVAQPGIANPGTVDPDTIDAEHADTSELETTQVSKAKQAWGRAVDTAYRYTRIQRDCVRLLVIKRGAQHDELNVTLSTVRRKHLGEEASYTALSYHWGSGDANMTIFVQTELEAKGVGLLEDIVLLLRKEKAKKLCIRPNLYAALTHLRRENEEISVWVDALCINQADEEEKSEQISQMPSIYRGAYNVCIWLGYDEGFNSVAATAMSFIPFIIDPKNHDQLLNDNTIPFWASLFELLEWSWFSRRWIVQEVALARQATVHCGNIPETSWNDFQDAIAKFDRDFPFLRSRLRSHFANKYPRDRRWRRDSDFEFKQLGAKLLVDITTNLFRDTENEQGALVSTLTLEELVCRLASFDSSDPRDAVNALINIASELGHSDGGSTLATPLPGFNKPVFYTYRHFVKGVVARSNSLDIICRHWALQDRKQQPSLTSPSLPSWIKCAKDGAFGAGYDVFERRKAGESLVGLPGSNCYHASGRGNEQKSPVVYWPPDPVANAGMQPGETIYTAWDMSIVVTGLIVGEVSFCTEPFPDGIITKRCLQRLGWRFNAGNEEVTEVPKQLWQTLVANRGPGGKPMPTLYRRACLYVMNHLTTSGLIMIDDLLRSLEADWVKKYLERVRAVTWNRLFMEAEVHSQHDDSSTSSGNTAKKLVGLGPPDTQEEDIIAILYGCSVPVILRPVCDTTGRHVGHRLIGEAFVYGQMDGEAFRGGHKEVKFRLF